MERLTKEQLILVKIGGSLLDVPGSLNQFLDDFHAIEGKKLLVHGGGVQANRVADALGIVPQMQGGRRITDAAMLEVVTMVYAGLNGKRIVALLQERGCNAVSLSGADGDAMRGVKRPAGEIDFGFVGDITPDGVGVECLRLFLQNDIVPVLNSVIHDGRGGLLNTNADTIAATVAVALAPLYNVDLSLVLDRPGVLRNPNDNNSVIATLSEAEIVEMKDRGTIAGGMLPKIDNALSALRGGVGSVRIGGEEMLRNSRSGTRIILKENDE